jgi:hypothetical protein
MSEADVKQKFPAGLRTQKPYLRYGAYPKD